MKAIKSKQQERQEIEHQVQFFLQHGGKVESIESGVSGRAIGTSFSQSSATFDQPRTTRTPLIDEVKAIDARKTKPPRQPVQHKKRQPKKVLITDDFGEPIRWSWQDS